MPELYNLNLTESDIKEIIAKNPIIKETPEEDITNLINILKQLKCTNSDIKNIIITNPFYLTSIDTDIINLINKLTKLGISNLNHLFDSNPYLLNKEAYEIDEFVNEMSKTYQKEEIIDMLENNPFLIDEL